MVSSFAVMHRHRMIAAIVLCMTAVRCLAEAPQLTILLDPVIKSETVEVQYMMEGKFGGFGGFVEKQTGLHEVRISTSVGNIPADAIKLLMWVPGCRMAAFAIYFAKRESEQRSYSCVPLSNVILIGWVPKELLTPGTEVEFAYLANWACNFFGLNDCMIPTILLPRIRPDSDGSFQIQLPDFSSDPIASQSVGGAAWQVFLREKNGVTLLRPKSPAFRTFANGLGFTSTYPEKLEFEDIKPDGLSPEHQDPGASSR